LNIKEKKIFRVTYGIQNKSHVSFFAYYDICLQNRSVSLSSLPMSFRQSEKVSRREEKRTEKKRGKIYIRFASSFLRRI
jgi:hypothetical protein